MDLDLLKEYIEFLKRKYNVDVDEETILEFSKYKDELHLQKRYRETVYPLRNLNDLELF